MPCVVEPVELISELCPGDDAEALQRGLEIAAALGSPVDSSEWCKAGSLTGATASMAVVDALVERGLVERGENGWYFVQAGLVDALSRLAVDAGRWKLHHAACAQALFELYPPRTPGVAARRASHLIVAGRHEAALQPLLEAGREAYDRGDFDANGDHLDQRDKVLDTLGADAEDPRRAQNMWRRARLLHVLGRREAVLPLIKRSRELLRQTDWASERAQAALLYGRILRDEGDFEVARTSFSDAMGHFATAGDEHGLASSRAANAFIDLVQGDHQQARRGFLQALGVFEDLGDQHMVASLLINIAQTWMVDGQRERAAVCARRARQIASEAGHRPNEAAALNALGELARQQSQWEEARRAYRAALEVYEADGNRNRTIARYNLALAEIGAGDFELASVLLGDLEQRYVEVGYDARLPLLYVGLMTCAAGQQQWDRFNTYYESARRSLDATDIAHDDIIWMGERAARLAAEHRETAAHDQARALVDEQRARLEMER